MHDPTLVCQDLPRAATLTVAVLYLQGLLDVRIIGRTAGQHRLVALSHMPQRRQKKVSKSLVVEMCRRPLLSRADTRFAAVCHFA